MRGERKELGDQGEKDARTYLEAHGYRIIETNYRTPMGELDIIASKGKAVIFIEVKTRISEGVDNPPYFPEDNIDLRKQRKLRDLARLYLSQKRYPDDQEWQIDVIAVEIDAEAGAPSIRHIEQAVGDI